MPWAIPSTFHKKTYLLDLGNMAYEPVWHLQREILTAKIGHALEDILIVVEHTPVYTVGRGKSLDNRTYDEDLIRSKGIQIFYVERGGDITWHGPGQLVCYPIFNLRDKNLGLPEFVYVLEEALILTLKEFDINGVRREGMRGVWVRNQKIASIGLAVKKGIIYHGIALNVTPDMSFFDWITPCTLRGVQMCSMAEVLGSSINLPQVKITFLKSISSFFGQDLHHISLEEISHVLDNYEKLTTWAASNSTYD